MYRSMFLRRFSNAIKHQRIPSLNAHLCTNAPTPPTSKENDPHATRSYEVITRLAKAACALREAIAEDARQRLNSPTLLLDLERDVESAFKIIKSALDTAERPCSVEQLADRKIEDELSGLGSALPYTDMLEAQLLRDGIENSLVQLQVLPPRDSLLKGAGRIPWKASKKDKKGLASLSQMEDTSLLEEEKVTELKELYPVTDAKLAERKKQLERATDVRQLLRGFDTALLGVSRVHKVVKGGTNMNMRALVVIGNRKGMAGFGEGKSENTQHAIERACRDARRNLLSLDLHEDRTLRHRVRGSFVKTQVDVWPAPRGTGVSASNDFSVILTLFGLKDVGAKLRGTRSLANSVKALFNALSQNSTAESVAAFRGEGFVPVENIANRSLRVKRVRGGL